MKLHPGRRNNGFVPSGGAGRVWAPGLEKRNQVQNGRVAQGINSGSLDSSEMGQIGKENTEYQKMLKDFKSNDGKVGPKERLALHKELNEMSKMIYDLKHN